MNSPLPDLKMKNPAQLPVRIVIFGDSISAYRDNLNVASLQLSERLKSEGIATLLKAIQEKAPASKILLMGILPRGESIREANNEKIRQTNAKLASLADNTRIFYLDVGDQLVEPDGSISKEIMPDKLHLAGPGYTRWMDAMKPTLDKLLNE